MQTQKGLKIAEGAGRPARLGRPVSHEAGLQAWVAERAGERPQETVARQANAPEIAVNVVPPFPQTKINLWKFDIQPDGPAGERDAKPNG